MFSMLPIMIKKLFDGNCCADIMRQITSAHEVNVLRVSSKTFYPYNVRFNSLYLISRNTEPIFWHTRKKYISRDIKSPFHHLIIISRWHLQGVQKKCHHVWECPKVKIKQCQLLSAWGLPEDFKTHPTFIPSCNFEGVMAVWNMGTFFLGHPVGLHSFASKIHS